jgi:hypothetical protein
MTTFQEQVELARNKVIDKQLSHFKKEKKLYRQKVLEFFKREQDAVRQKIMKKAKQGKTTFWLAITEPHWYNFNKLRNLHISYSTSEKNKVLHRIKKKVSKLLQCQVKLTTYPITSSDWRFVNYIYVEILV